jgi:hypothetical protein
MTQEEFIKILKKKRYSYEIEGDKIIVTRERDFNFETLTSIPPGVEFSNGGNVYLDSLTSLPSDVVFENRGDVNLEALIGGFFAGWKGNIEGIGSKRLLNLMIKRGMFI